MNDEGTPLVRLEAAVENRRLKAAAYADKRGKLETAKRDHERAIDDEAHAAKALAAADASVKAAAKEVAG
jgi:hypothetical protein